MIDVCVGNRGHGSGKVETSSSKKLILPPRIKHEIEAQAQHINPMKVLANIKSKFGGEWDEFVKEIDKSEQKIYGHVANCRRYARKKGSVKLLDENELRVEIARQGFAPLTPEMMRAVAVELHSTSVDNRINCRLLGELYSLGQEITSSHSGRQTVTACVLSKSCIVNIYNLFGEDSPTKRRGEPPSPFEIGICLGADGHFRSLRGCGGVLLIGACMLSLDTRSGEAYRWSLVPLIAGITETESQGAVAWLLGRLRSLISSLCGDNVVRRVTHFLSDSARGIITGTGQSLEGIMSIRCKFHADEAAERIPETVILPPCTTKDKLISYAKQCIAGLYQCAGQRVKEAYLEVCLRELDWKFGLSAREHFEVSWRKEEILGAFHHECPLALAREEGKRQSVAARPWYNNAAESIFSKFHGSFVERSRTIALGGQKGLIREVGSYLSVCGVTNRNGLVTSASMGHMETAHAAMEAKALIRLQQCDVPLL